MKITPRDKTLPMKECRIKSPLPINLRGGRQKKRCFIVYFNVAIKYLNVCTNMSPTRYLNMHITRY